MQNPHLQTAIDRLLQATPPGTKVILFGSQARGDAREDSDLDFLVVEKQVDADFFEETYRLRCAIKPLPVSVDIILTTLEQFDYWKDTINTVYHQAHKEGKLYESAA